MKTLILAALLTLPLSAVAKDVNLIAAGKTTNVFTKAKCGEKMLYTNVEPLPKGCVVIATKELASLPLPTDIEKKR